MAFLMQTPRLWTLQEELLEQWHQRLKIVLTRVPNDYWIDLVVAMYDPVAHTGHQSPRDLWMRLNGGGRHMGGRLANDSQIGCYSLESLGVREKLISVQPGYK